MTDENKLVFTKVASVSLVSLTLAIISFVAIVLIVIRGMSRRRPTDMC
jgi:hypothetical protein